MSFDRSFPRELLNQPPGVRLDYFRTLTIAEEWDQVEAGERSQSSAPTPPPSQQGKSPKTDVLQRASEPESQSGASAHQPSPQPRVTPKTKDAERTWQPERSAPTPRPKPQPAPVGRDDSTNARSRPAGLQGGPGIASLIARWRPMLGGLAAVVGIALVIWIGVTWTNKPGTTASPELTPSVSLPALSPTEFETVTLNNQGKEVDRCKLIAQYFTEDLDGVALEMVKVPSGTFQMGSPIEREVITDVTDVASDNGSYVTNLPHERSSPHPRRRAHT